MTTTAHAILCPYCGHRQHPVQECSACGGLFDRWSLQATQDDMGCWFVRDSNRPHFVGCSHEVLAHAIRSGELGMDTVVRGPTTRQFWTLARRAPGLAHLFARCFACQAPVDPTAPRCSGCGAAPPSAIDRNFAGLPARARIAPPADARPDLSAFIEDSGVLLVHVDPVLPAGSAGESPRLQRVPLGTPTAITVRVVEDESAAAAAQPLQVHAPQASRSALTPTHRGIADRARRLETSNRLLLGLSAISFAGAIVAVLFALAREDSRRTEIDAKVAEAIRSVRSEFERKPRVVIPPQAELPQVPDPDRALSRPAGRGNQTTPGTAEPAAPKPAAGPAPDSARDRG